MVWHFVRLKWRLLANGVRADRQRAVGLPVVAFLSTTLAWWLASLFLDTGRSLDAEAAGRLGAWVIGVAWLSWLVLPVLLFPLDEPLDPAQLALYPLPRPVLLTGLALAGFVTVPIVIPTGLLVADLALYVRAPAGLTVALPASLVLLLHLVVGGQAFTSVASLVFRSRRGRDLAVLLVGSLGFAAFISYQLVTGEITRRGLSGALRLHSLDRLVWASPHWEPRRHCVWPATGPCSAPFLLCLSRAPGFWSSPPSGIAWSITW